MSDPKRWREDDSELDSDARRLLRAGLNPRVPGGAKRAVWLALGAQLPPVVAAASATGASTLTAVSLLKSAAIGLVLGATTMGAVAVVRQAPTAPPSASALVHKPPVPAERGHVALPRAVSAGSSSQSSTSAAIPNDAARPPRVGGESAPAAPTLPATPSEASFPEDGALNAHDTENLRVRAARALLQAGRTEEALVVLERIRRELPNGELAQEREALSIEALRLLGRTAEARQRAAAFLERHPESPHAATARRAL